MAKEVIFNPQVALLEGASILERAVASTLGPKGSTVIIEHDGKALVTKDGVTVAFHIELEDPTQNFGAMLIKQAASNTAKIAGDGTTTSTIIATALAKAAYEEVQNGRHAIDVKREIDVEVEKLIEALNKMSTQVTLEDILPIASISANNDSEIGSLIQQAYDHVSLKGLIALDESKTGKTHITLNEGFTFDRGFISPYFITDTKKQETVLENPLILVTDKKLKDIQELAPILNKVKSMGRPVLIICDDMEGQALYGVTVNVARGALSACAVKAPSWGSNRGELLRDIAAITSATLISDADGTRLESITDAHLGTAAKVIITADSTTIIDGKASPEVAKRIEMIEHQIQQEAADDYITTQLTQRLAGLSAKVAVIHVGAATEAEKDERKARVDDALRATRAAISKGYVLGAGRTLMRLADTVKSESLYTALMAPFKKLCESVNLNWENVQEEILGIDPQQSVWPTSMGLNAKTAEVVDLQEAKIFDPTLVIEQAIINAASAASMILLSSTVVYNKDRTPQYHPGSLDDLSA